VNPFSWRLRKLAAFANGLLTGYLVSAMTGAAAARSLGTIARAQRPLAVTERRSWGAFWKRKSNRAQPVAALISISTLL
jgi:hypothetical protein